MTAQPFAPPPTTGQINWTMAGFVLALLVQFALAVSFGARAQAEIRELQATTEPLRTNRGALTARITSLEETTEPLRRGDLVAVQRDVAWIREHLEKEER
jgi:cell division protein FtsB